MDKLIEHYIYKYNSITEIPNDIIRDKPFLQKYIDSKLEIILNTKSIERNLRTIIKDFNIKQKKELLEFTKRENIKKKEIKDKINEIKIKARKPK
jgi:hypothetical protein